MKKLIIVLLVIVALKWWFTDPSIEVITSDPKVEPVTFNYLVKYPNDASKKAQLPLLIVLHGNGDTPENFYQTALDLLDTQVRIILVKAPIAYGRGTSWPGNAAGFKYFGEALHLAVENFQTEFPTSGKPILFGFSGGGMMAYYQALKYGVDYSVIVPVSGLMSESLIGQPDYATGAMVIAYHGKSDNVVSIGGAKQAIALLQSQNVEVDFTEFDGDHHGVFTTMKAEITRKLEQLIISNK